MTFPRKCITAGYFHQAARVKSIGEYMNVRTGVSGALALAVGQVGNGEADLWIAPLCVAPYQCSIRPRLYVLD
jgi:hypothetical protein